MICSEFPTRGDFKKATDKNAEKNVGKKIFAATNRERKLLILFRKLSSKKQQSLIETLDKY